MAARHKHHKKASGGVAMKEPTPTDIYAGGSSNVVKEAREKHKRGGKAMGCAEGGKARMRLDRPGRKRGGAAGSNMRPLSTAASVTKQNAVTNQDSEAG